jgi:hypothetical protein
MDANATTRISALANMNLEELRVEYQKVFGKPTKSRNRKQLFSQIARKLQGDETGDSVSGKPTLMVDLKKTPRKSRGAERPKNTTRQKSARPKPVASDRDPRLPKVGTTIERLYKGKKLLVTVEAEGFTFGSKHYRSLSALAKHITGQIINGFAFFGLAKKEDKSS